MERQLNKLLHDIHQSILSIESFVGEKKMFQQYQDNKLVKRAVERELEIIGEAMNRILTIEPNISITEPRRIVNFRNRIAHGYDSVDDAMVWGIIINHIPKLKLEVSVLLNT